MPGNQDIAGVGGSWEEDQVRQRTNSSGKAGQIANQFSWQNEPCQLRKWRNYDHR